METDKGLTIDWAMEKSVCSRFNKRRKWSDPKSSMIGSGTRKRLEESSPARAEETRRWLELGTVSIEEVKGLSRGVALEEMTKMVCNLSQKG